MSEPQPAAGSESATDTDVEVIGDSVVVPLAPHGRFGSWTEGSLCAQTDPELFFPKRADSPGKEAKRVCQSCDVSAECLAWALQAHPEGIWGGTTEREREELLREDHTHDQVEGAA